jgi:hypothetical protein
MQRKRFERLVENAVRTIPKRFRDVVQNLAIVVEDEPPADVLEEMEIEPPDSLFGSITGRRSRSGRPGTATRCRIASACIKVRSKMRARPTTRSSSASARRSSTSSDITSV